eukprot:5610953-Pyramimonas_sp.AAC.1
MPVHSIMFSDGSSATSNVRAAWPRERSATPGASLPLNACRNTMSLAMAPADKYICSHTSPPPPKQRPERHRCSSHAAS